MVTRASPSDVFDENSMPTLRLPRGGRGEEPPSLGKVDHYRIVRKLGGGGFGVVYLAYDTVSGMEVAIKTIHPLLKNDDEEMEQLRRKFALVARLAHPNIATALVLHPVREVAIADETARRELQLSPGESVMVMRYAPGITLSRWRRQFPEGRVPAEAAVEIARQLADALDYAHSQQIIHRDVKPANVMVEMLPGEGDRAGASGGSTLQVRMLDFGLAAEIRSSMSRHSHSGGDTSGTRPYMAPEQWAGRKQDGRTDQYALACVVYELLSGAPPFSGAFDSGDPAVMAMAVEYREPERMDDLSAKANEVLGRALAKRPDERFATCGAFVKTLASALGVGAEDDAVVHAGAASAREGNPKGQRGRDDDGFGKETLSSPREGEGGASSFLLRKRWAVGLAVVLGIVVLWVGIRHLGNSPVPESIPSVLPVDDLGTKLQRLVPGDAAGLDELVAAKGLIEAFKQEHPSRLRDANAELEALDERIKMTCDGKLKEFRDQADELRRRVDEKKYRRWNVREKLAWEDEKARTDNEFCRRFAAIDKDHGTLHGLEANLEAVKRAGEIVESLGRDVQWILDNESARDGLVRLEQESTDERMGLPMTILDPPMPIRNSTVYKVFTEAEKAMEEAKALRDAGRFNEAGSKFGDAKKLYEKVAWQTAENRAVNSAREELEGICRKVGGYAETAQKCVWQDQAYAARMATIREVVQQLEEMPDEDPRQCIEQARGLETKAAEALDWMKKNARARKNAAEAEKALAGLVAETAGSPVEARAQKRFAPSDRLAEQARRQLDNGQFEEAATTFSEARSKRQAALAQGYLEMARDHAENGRYREGLEAAGKAKDVFSGVADAADKITNDIRKRLDGRISELEVKTGIARDRGFDPAMDCGGDAGGTWLAGARRQRDASAEKERYQTTGDCEVALRAVEAYGEALQLFEKAEQLAKQAAEEAEQQARKLHEEELRQADQRCQEDIDQLKGELGEHERRLLGFNLVFDPAKKERIEKALEKAEACLKNGQREEAAQALQKARAVFEEVRSSTRVDPADGTRVDLELRDIRDKAGNTPCILRLVYDKKAGRWESEESITQGQWLAIGPPPQRFWPADETQPANFVNEQDVREWTRKLGERPECREWRFEHAFSGSGNNNERRRDARFTLIAWPTPP